jgi:hypothetical protein
VHVTRIDRVHNGAKFTHVLRFIKAEYPHTEHEWQTPMERERESEKEEEV